MSFLLDTDICSAYLKNNGTIANRFLQYGGRLHVSTVTLGELFSWAKRAKASPKRLHDLQAMRTLVTVLLIDETVAERFGEIRAALIDAGAAAPPMDVMNAAAALVHNLTMVTHNVADYANVRGLSYVDWLAP